VQLPEEGSIRELPIGKLCFISDSNTRQGFFPSYLEVQDGPAQLLRNDYGKAEAPQHQP